MILSRAEALIYRELQAMAGDLNQVAENITRDHEERVKETQVREKAEPGRATPMRGFDRPGLTRDLTFIRDRLNLLLEYASPEPHDPSILGKTQL
ncbi:hypothetical protein ES703_121482 [subsurface metagenome]